MRIVHVSIIVLSILFAFSPEKALGDDGAAVFQKMKCDLCHKPDKKSAAVPLTDIVKAYPDKGKLVAFFKGEAKPLIESEKWGMMRGPLTKIQALSDQEKEALADYLLSFK